VEAAMKGEPKSLAIIPARGGSKGLRRKNLRLLGGKPLIGYAISTALAAGCFDQVMVSTEDEEIASVAEACGASVPFLRPRDLAGDKASLVDAINSVLATFWAQGYVPEVVGTLLPTSPFRSSKMVREMTVNCLSCQHRYASTVRRVQQHLTYVNKDGQDAYLRLKDRNRLWAGGYYRIYGSYNVGRRISGLEVEPLYMHVLEHPAEWVDIDGETDLLLAEEILQRGMYEFDHEQ
jgi:CMP-N-acetylneuraminic acid synthetase